MNTDNNHEENPGIGILIFILGVLFGVIIGLELKDDNNLRNCEEGEKVVFKDVTFQCIQRNIYLPIEEEGSSDE